MALSHTHHQHDHPAGAAAHAHGAGLHGKEAPVSGGWTQQRKLAFAFALTALMMVAEAAGGWWSGSLALLADAGHMLVDALALLLALISARMALRPADARRSYGYGRMEVLAGFVNALTQFVLVAFIAFEAIGRLRAPVTILSGTMLIVAIVGLLVNVLVLRVLHDHAHDDLNAASASLHVLGDLLGSIAAVVAALLVRWLNWAWADPALSLFVSLLILVSAWQLLRRSTHILLEGVPEGINPQQVQAELQAAHPTIRDVHHLHVWQLASGSRMATLHAELLDDRQSTAALIAIKQVLADRFGVQHATVQVDRDDCPDENRTCSGHGHP